MAAVSLDWPLSRKEKEIRLVSLFQHELEYTESQRRSLKKELARERRRASLPAVSPSARASSPGLCAEDTAARTPSKLTPSASTPALSTPTFSEPATEPVAAKSPRRQSRSQKAAEAVAETVATAVARSVSTSSDRLSAGSRDGSVDAISLAEDEAASVTEPALTPRQRCLRSALVSFYKERQIPGAAHPIRLARMCGDRPAGWRTEIDEADIWAHICHKFNALPVQAVAYLSQTLPPMTLVQWPKDQVPDNAREAVDRILLESGAGESTLQSRHLLEVEKALKAQDNELLAALTFRGCAALPLRAEVWRTLLNGKRKRVQLEERREQYRKLRERVAAADLKAATGGLTEDSRALLLAARKEIAADMKGKWSGEAFLSQPGVAEAVSAIAFTTAARYGRYVRGSCEMATLLLFVMSCEGRSQELDAAEADAFWCLSQLMLDMNGTIVDPTNQAKQAQHIHYLLRLYDPVLAELLRGQGIVALPTTRFGVALFTRAGFNLPSCARLWDALLADPQRFEFCNYAIVAVLLLSRENLLKQRNDTAALAEAVLAAPRQADMDTVLAAAYAICAFERRCGDSSPQPYPPRPGVADMLPSAIEATKTHLTEAWGKVRAGGVGLWKKAKQMHDQRVAAAAAQTGANSIGVAKGDRDSGAEVAMRAALEVGII